MKSTGSSNKTISLMVADDDYSALEVLQLIISKKFPDLAIYTASSGEEGVELCNKYIPDIVITDINMPRMGGYLMAEKIKAIKGDTKFIVITGYSDKIHLEKFSLIGIADYMVKPINLNKMFATIEKYGAEITTNREGNSHD